MLDREPFSTASASNSPSRRQQSAASKRTRSKLARALEPLERRVMLSNTNTAAPTSDIHDLTNGPLANIGGNLTSLYLAYHTAQTSKTLLSFNKTIAKTPIGKVLDISGYTVGVALKTTGSVKAYARTLKAQGMSVRSVNAADHTVAGYLPIGLLRNLATDSHVASINAIDKPIVNSQGKATDQAETALSAATARTLYGLSGAGISVGVISNSVGQVGNGLADSIRTRDLPRNVTVLSDGMAGDDDEGRAILEQVYDIAPSAKLYFASGDGGQDAFAAAITSLKNAGCKVIIDDLTYLNEPYFQPGVIDDAITSAVTAGVSYFSSAGNAGNSGYLSAANFVQGLTPTGQNGFLVNFNPSGVAATKMLITVSTPGNLVLEWDDPYDGDTGRVQSDLDIYLYTSNGQSIRYESVDNNFGTEVPLESIPEISAGTYDVEIVAKNTTTASLPRYFQFVGRDDGGSGIIGTTQYAGIRTSIIGHNGGANTISVGAVDYTVVPTPENAGSLIPTEDFSASGPVIHDRDTNGTLLAAAQTLNKPDISATDGNDTSFFGDFDPQTGSFEFFGTSSAAGNAAGVAALLLQLNPLMTEAQLNLVLKSTAVPVNGQAQGSYDPTGGNGLIDTQLAAAQIRSGVVAPSAAFIPITPNPTTASVNTIEVDFSQPVTGVTLSDFTFTFNGGVNLLTGAQTVTSTDAQHYFINNLSSLDTALGTYVITLRAAGSGIVGTTGIALATDASTAFTKIKLIRLAATPSNLAALGISQGSIRLSFRDNSDNETSFVLQRSNNSTFTSKVKSFTLPANTTSYTDGNLEAATRYYYRVYAISADGTSDFSNVASDFTFSRGEVILDDAASTGVTLTGNWTGSTTDSNYYNSDYIQDDNTSKGHKTATFTPDLPTYGDYFIYAYFPQSPDNSDNVPVSIFEKPGVLLDRVSLDESGDAGPGRVLIGKYTLHSGTLSSVQIGTKGTSGQVIADAFQFLPAVAIAAPATSAVASKSVASASANAFAMSNKQVSSSDTLDAIVQ